MSPLSIPTCCNKTNELQNRLAFVEGRDAPKVNNINMKQCKKQNAKTKDICSISISNLQSLYSVLVGCNKFLLNVYTLK